LQQIVITSGGARRIRQSGRRGGAKQLAEAKRQSINNQSRSLSLHNYNDAMGKLPSRIRPRQAGTCRRLSSKLASQDSSASNVIFNQLLHK
jgi:hypothetical protein